MTRRMTGMCATAAFAATLFISRASGEDLVLRVKVPFAFTANGKSLPSGLYVFQKDHTKGFMKLSSADRAMNVMVSVITPLTRRSEADDRLLAFDKVDGKMILTEIWFGQQGVRVHATPRDQKHEAIWLIPRDQKVIIATASGD